MKYVATNDPSLRKSSVKPTLKRHGWFRWKYLLLGGFWVGMFIGTHLPKVPQPIRKISDKTMHCLAFAGLAFLLSWATYRKNFSMPRLWISIFTLIALYGAIDELLQIPVGRHCDFKDWLADMAGAIIGLTVFTIGLLLRRAATSAPSPSGRGSG